MINVRLAISFRLKYRVLQFVLLFLENNML